MEIYVKALPEDIYIPKEDHYSVDTPKGPLHGWTEKVRVLSKDFRVLHRIRNHWSNGITGSWHWLENDIRETPEIKYDLIEKYFSGEPYCWDGLCKITEIQGNSMTVELYTKEMVLKKTETWAYNTFMMAWIQNKRKIEGH